MKKSSKSGKARYPKIFVVIGKMKNEDSRGIRRLYRGRNFVPKFQYILLWRKHLKRRRKKGISALAIALKRPSAPKGVLGAQKATKSAQAHVVGCLAL